MIRFGVNLPNHPGGDACRDGVGGDVLGDHGPGPDDGAVPDVNAGEDDGFIADPDVVPNHDVPPVVPGLRDLRDGRVPRCCPKRYRHPG